MIKMNTTTLITMMMITVRELPVSGGVNGVPAGGEAAVTPGTAAKDGGAGVTSAAGLGVTDAVAKVMLTVVVVADVVDKVVLTVVVGCCCV
jgi:hypothetical protein